MRVLKLSCYFTVFLMVLLLLCGQVQAAGKGVSPAAVEFGEVHRGTEGNPAMESTTLNVISGYLYSVSLSGSDLQGQADPGPFISVEGISYRYGSSEIWAALTATGEMVVEAAPATGPEGCNHFFDFALDVPEDIVLQEYRGAVVFDVTTLMLAVEIEASPQKREDWGSAALAVDLTFTPADILMQQRSAWAAGTAPPEEGWSDWDSAASCTVSQPAAGEWYLHVQAKSTHGVDSSACFGPYRFDDAAPQVSFNPDGNTTYAQTHSPTVTVSDALSGVQERRYQWTGSAATPAGGTWTSFSSGASITTPAGLTGDYYLHIRALDKAGNTADVCSGVFKLDNTPPAAPTLNLDESWTNGNRSFTVTGGSDGHSGFVRQYRIGSGSWVTGDSGTVTAAGQTTVYARTVDGAGNISATVQRTAKIDQTAPTGSITINSGAAYAEPYKNVTLNLSASDSGGSGLTQMRFCDAGGTWTAWESYGGSKSWTLPTSPLNGTKTVQVQYRDGAGNLSAAYSGSIKVLALYWNGVVEPWQVGYSSGGGSNTQEIAASDGDGIHMYLHGHLDWITAGERTYVTSSAYNFSDISTVRITWKQTKKGTSVLAVSDNQMGDFENYTKRIHKTGEFGYMTESLTVGDVSGNRYIRVHAKRTPGISVDTQSSVHAYRIWVE